MTEFFYSKGGGDKRILEVKTDFKERAKPKVGSKDNIKFQPGEISQSVARSADSLLGFNYNFYIV